MASKNKHLNSIQLSALLLIMIFCLFVLPVNADKTHTKFLPINLINQEENKSFHIPTNNINKTPRLSGSVRMVKTYSHPAPNPLNTSSGLSAEINSFLDINTDLSAQNFNNTAGDIPNVSNLYFSSEIIPYHRLYLGQISLYDKNSPDLALFDSVENRYNLGNFESFEDIDAKITGNAGFLDYSAGAYNLNSKESNQSLRENNSVIGGWTAVNPLYSSPDLGKVQMGGGYFTNKHAAAGELDQEDSYSLFSSYKFNRFAITGEFLRENNGYFDNEYSDSWHFANRFAVTKGLSFKTGFKQYKETRLTISDVGFEYSFAENPLINIDHLRLEFNASFRRGEEWGINDSERFDIKTKYYF